MEPLTTLWCWVRGTGINNIFSVEIPGTETVEFLKETIKSQNPVSFRGVDANKLALYKVQNPGDEAELVQWTPDAKPRLYPWQKISEHFPEPDTEQWLVAVDVPASRAIGPLGVVPDLTLNCWVHGEAINCVFPVRISRTNSVAFLKKAIKDDQPVGFRDIEADALVLYKVSALCDEETLVGLNLEHEKPLSPLDLLSEVFPDPPLERHIHIVVVEPLSKKRQRSPDIAEEALKVPKLDPESMSHTEYYRMQGGTQDCFFDRRGLYWLDEASFPGHDLPPIEILYTGFGQFLDTYRAQRASGCVAGVLDHVEGFVHMMYMIYQDEWLRYTRGMGILNEIFFDRRLQMIEPSSCYGLLGSDGHYTHGERKVPCFLVVFKNEAAGSKSIPIAQLCSRYRQLVADAVTQDRDVVSRSRLPAIGLTVVGHEVTFWALAFVKRPVYSSLTPALSCVPGAGGGDDLYALHAAFIAARDLLARIEEDAEKLSQKDPRPPIIEGHTYPDITELPLFRDSGSMRVKIVGILMNNSRCHLYRAKCLDRRLDLVIKISRSYSVELHAFCAARGHAPKLHAYKKFPGDIFVVAMDYLDGTHLGLDGTQDYRNGMARQLRELVNEFHEAGLVHGDLRQPNFYCVKDTIMLLDFDWGGRVGEARYPTVILTPQLTKGRSTKDLRITKDDDRRVLENTLKDIGCS